MAAAVHITKPEVEGAIPIYQLHLHVAPQEVRLAFAWKLFDEGGISVPQKFKCHNGRGHIGAGDQDVFSNGDADRRQMVWWGKEQQGLLTFNYTTRDMDWVNFSWGIDEVSLNRSNNVM